MCSEFRTSRLGYRNPCYLVLLCGESPCACSATVKQRDSVTSALGFYHRNASQNSPIPKCSFKNMSCVTRKYLAHSSFGHATLTIAIPYLYDKMEFKFEINTFRVITRKVGSRTFNMLILRLQQDFRTLEVRNSGPQC